jgi:hypothetical protein
MPELWKALAYLFPNAHNLAGYVIQDDGNGPYIAQWGLPDPQPTETELAAAIVAYDAAQAQRDTEAAALRQQIITLAQSAVGVRIDNLTAAQVRALVAILLWKGGALDKDGNVRPLGQWT